MNSERFDAIGERVCAVTVTYGDRVGYLRGLIDALINQGVLNIIVVANGVSCDVKSQLVEIKNRLGELISIVYLPENFGSAGGFYAGIEAAVKTGLEYVVLFDDDNLPKVGAVNRLLGSIQKLEGQYPGVPVGVLGYRVSRKKYQRIVRYGPELSLPPRSSFIAMSPLTSLFRIIAVSRNKKDKNVKRVPSIIPIPYGCYGGLMFPLSIEKIIGLPERKLKLYVDDLEYTARMVRNGGVLCLDSGAVIDDQEISYDTSMGGVGSLESLFSALNDDGVYHAVRNRVWFDLNVRRGSSVVYVLNKIIVLFVIVILSFKNRNIKRLSLIIKAINDGEHMKI